ncbi:Aminomethyltransferase [Aquisphaera giovannonii]|uniref:Aminomethyltransferase n=1 Tax=Aquisphaera giovannonii TaxID=406548 RepID=A0A5B9VYR6_9BACT|nr:glycine cleavage T C-terminal barrel domain-containing protein [Aquisphaera giovannonii]QEH33442.1 Aminomethyltransferase [Aquisphaera giovannonii]
MTTETSKPALDLDAYRAAGESAAWCDRSSRARLEIGGPDRAKFLHNLTTNDVKRLPAGRGREAFVTSPQGKTIGFVNILACPDAILVVADPGGLDLALPHFTKYGVFDDITLTDLSGSTFEYHVVGPRSGEVVSAAGASLPDADDLAVATAAIAGHAVTIVREAPAGRPGLTILGQREGADDVRRALLEAGGPAGLVELDPGTFEAMRIEAGTPAFGRDLDAKNLPQEAGRDRRAINFVKGCYLGQETVARIDALGHVNQHLLGLRLDPEAAVPPPGSVVEAEGKAVGRVTSAAFSPGWGVPIALALIRSSHAKDGAVVAVKAAEGPAGAAARAVVSALPMIPDAADASTA